MYTGFTKPTALSDAGQTMRELEATRAHSREVTPPSALDVLDKETARLMMSGLLEKTLKVGDTAPDFVLPGVDGKSARLHELLQQKPVVLTFYRGRWCPYCNIALAGLQRSLPRLYDAQLVAISPQLPDNSMTTAEKQGLTYPLLSDVGSHVAESFGVAFTLSDDLRYLYRTFGHGLEDFNGHETGDKLPIPATFVIGQDGHIVWRFVDVDYTRRADPDAIIEALERLSR